MTELSPQIFPQFSHKIRSTIQTATSEDVAECSHAIRHYKYTPQPNRPQPQRLAVFFMSKQFKPLNNTVTIPTNVFYDENISRVDIAVYLIIQTLDYGEDRVCYASNEYLANSLGIPKRSVIRSLKKLEECGHISRGRGDGRKRTLKPNHGLFSEKNDPSDKPEPKQKKADKNFTPDTADVLRAFAENVNPNCETMYHSKVQREAAQFLIKLIGKDKLINKTIPSLAEWNSTPYLTKDERAFTPSELKSRMARIAARMNAEKKSNIKRKKIIL